MDKAKDLIHPEYVFNIEYLNFDVIISQSYSCDANKFLQTHATIQKRLFT